jgi:hypothetical protein
MRMGMGNMVGEMGKGNMRVGVIEMGNVMFLLDVCPTWTRGVALMDLQRRSALRRYETMGYQRV